MIGDVGPTGDTGENNFFPKIKSFKLSNFLLNKGPTGDKGVLGDVGPTGDTGKNLHLKIIWFTYF